MTNNLSGLLDFCEINHLAYGVKGSAGTRTTFDGCTKKNVLEDLGAIEYITIFFK